jgi:hypothetical protein
MELCDGRVQLAYENEIRVQLQAVHEASVSPMLVSCDLTLADLLK